MADDLQRQSVPRPVRVSEAERERVAEQLQAAVGEGRISLAELDQRLSLVYSADTRLEVDAVMADLPFARPLEALEVHRVKAFTRIDGRWEVPAFLTVGCYDAVTRIDFRQASIGHPAVRIALSAAKSIVRLQLPPGHRSRSTDWRSTRVSSATGWPTGAVSPAVPSSRSPAI